MIYKGPCLQFTVCPLVWSTDLNHVFKIIKTLFDIPAFLVTHVNLFCCLTGVADECKHTATGIHIWIRGRIRLFREFIGFITRFPGFPLCFSRHPVFQPVLSGSLCFGFLIRKNVPADFMVSIRSFLHGPGRSPSPFIPEGGIPGVFQPGSGRRTVCTVKIAPCAAEGEEAAEDTVAEGEEAAEKTVDNTEAINAAKADAQAILDKALASEDPATADLDAIAKEVNEEYSSSTGNFTVKDHTDTTLDPAVVEAAANLADGEYASEPVIGDDEENVYVVRLDKVFDEDATEYQRKTEITSRKQEKYGEVVDGWVEEAKDKTTLNEKAWAKVTVTDKEPYTLVLPAEEETTEDESAEVEDVEETAEDAAEEDTAEVETAEETAEDTAAEADTAAEG